MMLKRDKKALAWFLENGPAHLFAKGDPSLATVRKLQVMGLVETCGTVQGFANYRISEAGRRALEE